MARSTVVIYALWVVSIGCNLVPLGQSVSREECGAHNFPLWLFLLPIFFFSACACVFPRSPFSSPLLSRLVDNRFGPNTYESFLTRLKPALMFGVSALIGAGAYAFRCTQSELTGLGMFWFASSAGLAFLALHFIMRLRRIPGV